ncbi:hypothetical protein VTO73DRAFT_8489 [Trametes versicolor]
MPSDLSQLGCYVLCLPMNSYFIAAAHDDLNEENIPGFMHSGLAPSPLLPNPVEVEARRYAGVDTLDEPVTTTIARDLLSIYTKLVQVLYTRQKDEATGHAVIPTSDCPDHVAAAGPCTLHCDGAYTVSAAAVDRIPSRHFALAAAEEAQCQATYQYGPTAELSSSLSHGNIVPIAHRPAREFWGRGPKLSRKAANHAKSWARSALSSKRRLTRTWRAHEKSHCPPTSDEQAHAQSAEASTGGHAMTLRSSMLRLLRQDSADVDRSRC